MKLLVLDIGGTYVKYNIWEDKLVEKTKKFETPENYSDLKESISKIIKISEHNFEGIAISAPGNYDPKTQMINGISAVPYIHHFNIVDDLEKTFNLTVAIENDANCAGLCEKSIGIGKNIDNLAFLVLGTGVGGSLFFNGELFRGTANRSGEFGLTKNNSSKTLSKTATIVKVIAKYEEIKGEAISGQELYELYRQDDQLAIKLIHEMYDDLALFIYNLQVSLDIELVVIGGGVSAQEGFAEALEIRVHALLEEEGVSEFKVDIKPSQYKNDANLIGAAIAFNHSK